MLLVGALVVGGGTLLVALSELVIQFWTVRRVVRRLRSLSPARLRHALEVFDDVHVRGYLEQLVASHGAPNEPGPVERFGFSPIDRRENACFRLIAIATFVLGIVAAIALPEAFQLSRVIGAALALVSLIFIVLLERRGRRLQRRFEVSAFSLAELLPCGEVRRLHWGEGLMLRNRRWRRRIEIGPAGGSDAIVVPYAIVGFERAVELILEKGGFEPGG
jgi:hypothetical protein